MKGHHKAFAATGANTDNYRYNSGVT